MKIDGVQKPSKTGRIRKAKRVGVYSFRLYMPSTNFQLPGKTAGWVGTGIYLKAGQTARISAGGIITCGPWGSWPFGPDGELNQVASVSAPAPGLVRNGLVARAGYLPVYIGSSGEITADRDAQLIVALNDDWTADNDGHWMLSIAY
jgi:hypothetical protein